MAIGLITNYLPPYRIPLYERLAQSLDVEVLCYGGEGRYVPAWLRDLDAQLAGASFPARRIDGPAHAFSIARAYDAVVAPFAGGAILPAAYAGARAGRRPFILWASVWAQPRSPAHVLALPATRHIYRHADAVVAYGEHVRRFVASIRGHDADVFVAPQSVEPELFGREVGDAELDSFRERHRLPTGPLVLYTGRLVAAKGIDVLLEAWRGVPGEATLVVIGDGPLTAHVRKSPRTRFLGPLARGELPVAYASAAFVVLPSVPTRRFIEPWGLVCNEAMHQGRTVIATDAVGAVAGGLVRDEMTGLVVPAADANALRESIERLLADESSRTRLGIAAKKAVAAYNYDAMVAAFDGAVAIATGSAGEGRIGASPARRSDR